LCGYFATKSIWIHVIDESAVAVDLHDREPLAVARLQLGIAVDFDLLQFERDLLADQRQDLPCALAKVASLCVVEDYLLLRSVQSLREEAKQHCSGVRTFVSGGVTASRRSAENSRLAGLRRGRTGEPWVPP